MDTRAVWQYEPIMATWNLYLMRGCGLKGNEVAMRRSDGQIVWEAVEPYTTPEVPPLLAIPDWLLRDVILPAAPGGKQARELSGEVEALREALKIERERIDMVLDRSLPAFESDAE